MIGFFPFPYPVVTPLGEAYAIYVVPAPLYENDCWACQLDDGRILQFSTNQLRGVANGTYEIRPPRPSGPALTKAPIVHLVSADVPAECRGEKYWSEDLSRVNCGACHAAVRAAAPTPPARPRDVTHTWFAARPNGLRR